MSRCHPLLHGAQALESCCRLPPPSADWEWWEDPGGRGSGAGLKPNMCLPLPAPAWLCSPGAESSAPRRQSQSTLGPSCFPGSPVGCLWPSGLHPAAGAPHPQHSSLLLPSKHTPQSPREVQETAASGCVPKVFSEAAGRCGPPPCRTQREQEDGHFCFLWGSSTWGAPSLSGWVLGEGSGAPSPLQGPPPTVPGPESPQLALAQQVPSGQAWP